MTLTPQFFDTPRWVLGLMSGTSADGVDGALLQLCKDGIKSWGPTLYHAYSDDLRQSILKAMGEGQTVPLRLEHDITVAHYKLVRSLIRQSKIIPDLIGFHGQTMFHVPRIGKHKARTLQIGDAANLAHWLNIPVVGQFRLQDIHSGGEGAPLVPIFHRAMLEPLLSSHELAHCAVINIGGVCNVTLFNADGALIAGDVGPGCALIDDWINLQTTMTYDDFSELALQGQVHHDVAQRWLQDVAFFAQPLPKSADRLQWRGFLNNLESLGIADIAATLTHLTVSALKQHLPITIDTLYVAGGGRKHVCLMHNLSQYYRVLCVDDIGCSGDFLEAYAFAFLARQSILKWPISFTGTTGVLQPTSGGVLYFVK